MAAVLLALGTMAAVAVVGWLLGRSRALGPGAEQVLARTVFLLAAPCLLAVTVAEADLGLVLSRGAAVTALSTALVALVAVGVLRGLWRRPAGEATVGALAASYLNAGNLGIPVAVYLLGSAVPVVPVLLFQLLVLAPVAFTVLDAARARADRAEARSWDGSARDGSARDGAAGARPATGGAVGDRSARSRTAGALATLGGVVRRTLRNPIIIGALTGLALAALPGDLPAVVREPLRLVGATAAPLALLAFGMSLAAARAAGDRWRPTRELALVVVLRGVVHPALAAALGLALGLQREALLAVVTMAALPTAQNVLVYALQYGRGREVARDAGVVTTLVCVPVLVVVAALLGA